MRVRRIILHHSATRDSGTVSWNAMRRWHVNHEGWDDIGYHLGFEAIADPWTGKLTYEGLVGRPLHEEGAHAKGHNGDSIGVVFVGDYTMEPPPDEMLLYAARHLAGLCHVLDLEPDHKTIFAHRALDATECPGAKFPLGALIEMVKGRM